MKPLIVLWSWIKYLYPLTWLCWWRRGYLVWRQCILMSTSSTLHLHRLMIVLSLNINIFLSVYNYQFCMVCTVHNLKLNKTRLNVGKKKITLLIRSVFLLYICWWKIATDMQLPVFKLIGINHSVLQTNETSFFWRFAVPMQSRRSLCYSPGIWLLFATVSHTVEFL